MIKIKGLDGLCKRLQESDDEFWESVSRVLMKRTGHHIIDLQDLLVFTGEEEATIKEAFAILPSSRPLVNLRERLRVLLGSLVKYHEYNYSPEKLTGKPLEGMKDVIRSENSNLACWITRMGSRILQGEKNLQYLQ